jgi:hypothetical protein
MSRQRFELQRTRSEEEREAASKRAATIPDHANHYHHAQSEDEYSADESVSAEYSKQALSAANSICGVSQAPPGLTDTSMYSEEGSNADYGSQSSEAASLDVSSSRSFLFFRLNYLLVTLVIMLADGLQGELWRLLSNIPTMAWHGTL